MGANARFEREVRALIGLGYLVILIVPWTAAAVRARRRWWAELDRPAGALAATMFVLTAIIVVSEGLGIFGWFRLAPLLGVSTALGVAVIVAIGSQRGRVERAPWRPRFGGDCVPPFVVMSLIAAAWLQGTAKALREGISEYDSIAYHLPHAAVFARSGHLFPLHYVSPGDATAYHPSNTEVVHAVGMLLFRGDIASTVINLGALVVLLLAGWCIGDAFHAGIGSMIAVGLVTLVPGIALFQPGTALNDVASIAFVLAGAAFLLRSPSRSRDAVLVGLATGLGLGTKLTVLPLALGLVVASALLARKRTRLRTAVVTTSAAALTSAFWFARNALVVGSPLPGLTFHVGPFSLPHPPMVLVDEFGFSVVHYVTDLDVWKDFFLPGLGRFFGPLWFVLLAATAAGLIGALRHAPRQRRAVALVGVLALAGYVLTPSSAYGPPGAPGLFTGNLRYALPGMAVGMVLLPTLAAVARRSNAFAWSAAAFAAITMAPHSAWAGRRLSGWFAATAIGVTCAIALSVASRGVRVSRRLGAAIVSVSVIGAVVAGVAVDRRYERLRYTAVPDETRLFDAWGNGVSHTKIAVVGLPLQYPFFGPTFSNDVEYLGHLGSDHSFTDIVSCADWMRELADRDFSFVVARRSRGFDYPAAYGWMKMASSAREIVSTSEGSVFAIESEPDPSQCRP